MRHAFHVIICFFSGSTCLIEKPLTLITFTTNMISKIFCPLSPKSQSMTCFDNSKRAQIKHNKVYGSTNIGRIDKKAEVSQEHDSHYRICLLTRLLSGVFFNPCNNFPFPTRNNVIVIHHFLFHCSKLRVQSFERISVVS